MTDKEIDDLANRHFGVTQPENFAKSDSIRRAYSRAIESAATAPLLARIAEQQRTIECLNSIINDHGPTTENVTIVGQLERRIAELERQPVAHHPV